MIETDACIYPSFGRVLRIMRNVCVEINYGSDLMLDASMETVMGIGNI